MSQKVLEVMEVQNHASDSLQNTCIQQVANGQNVVLIREFDLSSESSVYTDSSEEDIENKRETTKKKLYERSATYSQIQKLIRYLNTGNPTATVVSLSCLKDENLSSELTRDAIKDNGGLQTLINLLETKDKNCKTAALLILKEISDDRDIAKSITDLGAIPAIVRILEEQTQTFKCLAAETIANIAKIQKARKIVRKTGGIPKLIMQLEINDTILSIKKEDLDSSSLKTLEVLRTCCRALWSLSKSTKSKAEICKFNVVNVLNRLLRCCHVDIVIPVLGTITQCASQKEFQIAMQKEGTIEHIVKYISTKNEEIKTHCAYAVFKCAENLAISNLIRQYGGLDPLVGLISDESTRENKILLSAATGAIWKCATNPDNLRRLDELNIVETLIQLLQHENEEVLINSTGAIAECAKLEHNREIISKLEGITVLVNLLNSTSEFLLENICRILAECAENEDCIQEIVKYDGIRLLWSLLRSSSPKVQAGAAYALVPCIQNADNSAEMIRNFSGGLELLVSLLESKNDEVLARICATVTEVAKSPENLAVITDLNIVQHLAFLVHTKSEMVREHLAAAIANCCTWGPNCSQFGQKNAVKPLVGYMNSKNINIQRTTALALFRLSEDPTNCITLHRSGIVKLLLRTIASTDESLQESSAGCLSNIRNLALESHKQ